MDHLQNFCMTRNYLLENQLRFNDQIVFRVYFIYVDITYQFFYLIYLSSVDLAFSVIAWMCYIVLQYTYLYSYPTSIAILFVMNKSN